MKKVTIYTTQTCPYGIRAKTILEDKGLSYYELWIYLYPELAA